MILKKEKGLLFKAFEREIGDILGIQSLKRVIFLECVWANLVSEDQRMEALKNFQN